MLSLGCVPFQFAHATQANATSRQKNKRVYFNTKLILYRHSLYMYDDAKTLYLLKSYCPEDLYKDYL